MKILTSFAAIALTFVFAPAHSDAKPSFALHSSAFADGAAIPHDYSFNAFGCTGKNRSPELHWSGAPSGTKSFALIVFDPDANQGKGWWHWVVYGIDPTTRSLAPGEPFLDEPVGGSHDGPALLGVIKGHVLGKAVLVGRFGR